MRGQEIDSRLLFDASGPVWRDIAWVRFESQFSLRGWQVAEKELTQWAFPRQLGQLGEVLTRLGVAVLIGKGPVDQSSTPATKFQSFAAGSDGSVSFPLDGWTST